MSSTTNRFARAFSLRDRARGSSKTRSSALDGLFVLEDGRKKITKDEERKVQEITQQIASLGLTHIPEARIEYALRTKSAQGDVKEAMRLLILYEDSVAGVLRRYNPNVKLLGAENRERVTCWLDSLLFAMFAKSDVFEAVLFNTYNDEPRKNLVTILRLWVNLLRTGRLITVDVTKKLQAAIADCGWAEAAKIRQQDVSEAFNFITDKLQLPLLTLKTDIYHSGKEDASDDHKFITERMLDVAIPSNVPQGRVIKLESCLEEYFNNRVEVKRILQRRNTVNSMEKGGTEDEIHVETVEVGSRTSSPAPSEYSRKPSVQRPLHMRVRATSIFSERKVSTTESTSNGSANGRKASEGEKGSVRKEVLMPAWQFLNLIPWYTDNVPENESQVRSHFSHKRLMLGICLKRYGMTANNTPYRRNTHIDIPLEMASPHFTTGDEVDQEGAVTQNFKLSLKSVVCHRGHSVDAGHYVALVRAESPGVDRHEAFADPASERAHDQSHDSWLRFDDLATQRVTTVDITKALKEESPYLLFYRVQPIVDDSQEEENPPPYQESEASLDIVDQKLANLERGSRDSVDAPDWQSPRESLELPSPGESRGRSSISSLRRVSVQAGSPSTAASIRTEVASTDPPTPLEEAKSTASDGATRSSTQTTVKPVAEDTSKRFGASMSKLASKLSRDKLQGPDAVAAEKKVEESPPPPPPAPQTQAKKAKDDSTDGPAKLKPKDKKKKVKPTSRRDSLSHGAAKPERECIVM